MLRMADIDDGIPWTVAATDETKKHKKLILYITVR